MSALHLHGSTRRDWRRPLGFLMNKQETWPDRAAKWGSLKDALSTILLTIIVSGCAKVGDDAPSKTPLISRCPIICVKSEQAQGCVGGCAVPGSATQAAVFNDVEVEKGVWLRGTGPNGTQGDSPELDITVRHLRPEGLVECTFSIDGSIYGDRTHTCPGSVGDILISVTPQ